MRTSSDGPSSGPGAAYPYLPSLTSLHTACRKTSLDSNLGLPQSELTDSQ